MLRTLCMSSMSGMLNMTSRLTNQMVGMGASVYLIRSYSKIAKTPTSLKSSSTSPTSSTGATKTTGATGANSNANYANNNTNSKKMISVANNGSSIFSTLSSLTQHGFSSKYPKIITIGNQSAGKTSLTEAMCGINGLFEKKSGMATKRPTVITLIRSNDGDDYIKIGSIGEKIYNVERAQQRLLEENDGDITEKPLELIICSSNIEKECVFVDLPGFITATKSEEDSELPKRIREICLPYITDASNIKMVVMSATEDPALSYALKLVKKHGQMENAIGVFTKIDMVTNDKLQGRQLLELLNDRSYIPHLGVVGVKLRSAADIASNTSIPDMLKNEINFIERYKLANRGLNLGVPKLMDMISSEQLRRIQHTFPAIKEQVSKLLEQKKKGQGVIRRLIESDDIHDISVELERIITDLHPLSPIRVSLERTIMFNIRAFVKHFVSERMVNTYPGHLHTVDRQSKSSKGNFVEPHLHYFRDAANKNKIKLDDFSFSDKLGDYMILGETNQEISIPELEQTVKDNMIKGILTSFVQVLHPGLAPVVKGDYNRSANFSNNFRDNHMAGHNSTVGKMKVNRDVVDSNNRVQFVRDIQKVVTALSSPEFTREAVSIVTTALKEFVVRNSVENSGNYENSRSVERNSETSGVSEKVENQVETEARNPGTGTAELFFIHIFDIICERSGLEDLNQSLNRMIRREHRPYIDYSDLVTQAYKRHLECKTPYKPASEIVGFFTEDQYPLALHMYSPQMFEAYMDELVERMSRDLFRILAVNLLNPIITTTIEVSLKTFKHKDFSKQEKAINESIKTLESQLSTIENLSKGSNSGPNSD